MYWYENLHLIKRFDLLIHSNLSPFAVFAFSCLNPHLSQQRLGYHMTDKECGRFWTTTAKEFS